MGGRVRTVEPPAYRRLADLLVADRDLVTGVGLVVFAPGRPARLCGSTVTSRMRSSRPPSCPDAGLDLAGAERDLLIGGGVADGVRWGVAAVTGRLSGRTLTVTEQGPARPEPRRRPEPLEPLEPRRDRRAVDEVWLRIGPPAALADWADHGCFGGGPRHDVGRVALDLLLVDAAVVRWLRSVDPDGIVDVRPAVWPARLSGPPRPSRRLP